MSVIRIKQSDTFPLEVVLKANNSAVPLTGASVEFHMRPKTSGLGSVVEGPCEIVDEDGGRVSYAWLPEDVNTPGHHRAEFQVTFEDGTVETFPRDGYLDVEILAELG